MKKYIVPIISILIIFFATFIFLKHIFNNQATSAPNTKTASEATEVIKTEKEKDTTQEIPAKQTYSVPILMYHYIRDYNDPEDKIGVNLSVSPQKFEQQIKYLKENNYTPISFSDLISKKFPDKSAVITFDDGYEDAFINAYPILKKYEMTGVFYIIVNKVGQPGYLSWDQIIKMQSDGMLFGSHSISHPNLSLLPDEKIEKELSESKQILEEKLNVKINDFCYPSGKYSNQTIKMLEELGYTNSVTTKSGISDETSNIFELPRLRITEETSISKIIQ